MGEVAGWCYVAAELVGACWKRCPLVVFPGVVLSCERSFLKLGYASGTLWGLMFWFGLRNGYKNVSPGYNVCGLGVKK